MGWKEEETKNPETSLYEAVFLLCFWKLWQKTWTPEHLVLHLPCLPLQTKSWCLLHSSTSSASRDCVSCWVTALQQDLALNLSTQSLNPFQGAPSWQGFPSPAHRARCCFPVALLFSDSAPRASLPGPKPWWATQSLRAPMGNSFPPDILSVWDWWSHFPAVQQPSLVYVAFFINLSWGTHQTLL